MDVLIEEWMSPCRILIECAYINWLLVSCFCCQQPACLHQI